MTPTLRLDYGNMIASRVEGGITASHLESALADGFSGALAVLETRREAGELGFLDLPHTSGGVERVHELSDGFAQWFTDVVVLGIGGSALGAIALRDALLGPYWNDRDEDGRDHFPRLHVVDNPDPHTFRALLDRLDAGRTMFNVVSKSGGTAETMALYLVARQHVVDAVGEDKARGHFLFTTDPETSALRRIGEPDDIPMLPIPQNVGGRFSVLSAVGLFPAAACGVDVDALLAGAAAMEERCRTADFAQNPAGILAALLHHSDTVLDRPIHVLMPYSDRLRSLALWFQQLWAESLGKAETVSGEVAGCGPTPLAAVGPADQHSLLQLFMEGPDDKVVVFLRVADPGSDVTIPDLHPEVDALSYLAGAGLGELLDSEQRATAEALRRVGKPNLTIELPEVGPAQVGAAIMLLQITTVLAGAMYGVDPLDQPGVELGKRLTNGLMGRAGSERPDILEPDARWVV